MGRRPAWYQVRQGGRPAPSRGDAWQPCDPAGESKVRNGCQPLLGNATGGGSCRAPDFRSRRRCSTRAVMSCCIGSPEAMRRLRILDIDLLYSHAARSEYICTLKRLNASAPASLSAGSPEGHAVSPPLNEEDTPHIPLLPSCGISGVTLSTCGSANHKIRAEWKETGMASMAARRRDVRL